MRIAPILFLLLLLPGSLAMADEPSAVVSLPGSSYVSGESVTFSVFFHNTGAGNQTLAISDQMLCLLELDERSKRVSAVLTAPLPAGETVLAPGTFVECRYRFTIPDDMDGTARLRLVDYNAAPVMLALLPAAPPRESAVENADGEPVDDGPSMESLFTLYQPYVDNISAYEPMYFLVGTEPEKSKFQLSIKYLFFGPQSRLGQLHPWLQGLHFGYTQTSYWDLDAASAPFEDTSYKPELFYLSNNISARPAWMKGFFLQSGVRHESNGRGGDASRSTNTCYVKPMFVFYNPQSHLGLLASPRISAYVENDDDTNRDLPDYRGYFELELKMGKAEGAVLGSTLRFAPKGTSLQLDLTYPLNRLWENAAGIYLQAQYVDAYAESLIDYKERKQAFRLGFAMVR